MMDLNLKVGLKIIAIVLGGVLIGVVVLNWSSIYEPFKEKPSGPQEGQETRTQPTVQNTSKAKVPIIEGLSVEDLKVLSKNSDFIYNRFFKPDQNLSEFPSTSGLPFPSNTSSISQNASDDSWGHWKGTFIYYRGYLPLGSKNEGVMLLHPGSKGQPGFVRQNLSLSKKGSYALIVKIGNMANQIGLPCGYTCSDSVIRIKLKDRETGKEDLIFKDVVVSKEGWKVYALNISKYRGKNLSLKVEGQLGGSCASRCGEWSSVEEVYLGRILT